jgi:ribulose-5-phosphate 4-epimerase/fuculose-1-phosphate aldolase
MNGMELERDDDGGLYRLKQYPEWRGLDVELTPQQELACAFRILAAAGCNVDIAGHITMVADESGNMWVNPWGMWWEEVRASDILLVSPEGEKLAGRWEINGAIFIHTEVHQRRGEVATVAVHNHPYYGVLLGTMGIVPEITDQQACMFKDEVGLWDEYTGGVSSVQAGVKFADAVGDRSVVLLAHHGCLVTAPNIAQAAFKVVTFERTCKLNYDAIMAGVKPAIVPEEHQGFMKNGLLRYSSVMYWEGAVRQLLAQQPDVLN